MNRVAIVTGASGGLGSEMARQFAAAGVRVVVITCPRNGHRKWYRTSPDVVFQRRWSY